MEWGKSLPHETRMWVHRGGCRGGVGRVPMNPPFERAFLTRNTLIEQSNRDTVDSLKIWQKLINSVCVWPNN